MRILMNGRLSKADEEPGVVAGSAIHPVIAI